MTFFWKSRIFCTLTLSINAKHRFVSRKQSCLLQILLDLQTNSASKKTTGTKIMPWAHQLMLHSNRLARKFFCKLDCWQTYRYLNMSYKQFVQFLDFTFASWTFASNGVAKSLSWSLSAFARVMRNLKPELGTEHLRNTWVPLKLQPKLPPE